MSLTNPKSVPHAKANVVGNNATILLFGHTGSGKTAQIGELAEYYYTKHKKKTRLYSADKGGWETIRPHVELGLIDAIPMFGEDPWHWIDHAVKGDKLKDGLWVPGVDPDIAMYAYEGMTSFADAVMLWMSQAASKGVNIGGQGAFSFMVGQGKDALKIGSNNMAHYSVAQQQVYDKSGQSQNLPGTVLWTAGDSQAQDDTVGAVVGPQIAGKAMTSNAPRWFKYTWHITSEAELDGPAKHVLYTDTHIELNSKGQSKAMTNSRVPLAGKVDIPVKIEPASLVNIIELLEQRQISAKEELKARLGL